jgi:hypothetical protein
MAKHDVELKVGHAISIGNKDIELPVKRDGKAFGRLRISTGSIDWVPAGKQKAGYWLDWATFADVMAKHGWTK